MFELFQSIVLSSGSLSDIKSRWPLLLKSGGKSLRDLTLDAGADPQVYRALLHLMRNGELRCMAHEIINP